MQPEIKIPPIIAPPLSVPPPSMELSYATPKEFAYPLDWTNIEVFTLDPKKRNRFLCVVISLQISARLLLIAVVIAVDYLMRGTLDLLLVVLLFAILGSMMLFSLTRIVLRFIKSWPINRVLIADQGFIYYSVDKPPMHVSPENISRIIETFDSFKILLPAEKYVTLSKWIPNQDIPKLRARIQQFHPISHGKGTLGLLATIALQRGLDFTNIALFYVGVYTPHTHITFACIILTSLITSFRLYQLSRNKLLRTSTKIALIINLILPIILILKYIFA